MLGKNKMLKAYAFRNSETRSSNDSTNHGAAARTFSRIWKRYGTNMKLWYNWANNYGRSYKRIVSCINYFFFRHKNYNK